MSYDEFFCRQTSQLIYTSSFLKVVMSPWNKGYTRAAKIYGRCCVSKLDIFWRGLKTMRGRNWSSRVVLEHNVPSPFAYLRVQAPGQDCLLVRKPIQRLCPIASNDMGSSECDTIVHWKSTLVRFSLQNSTSLSCIHDEKGFVQIDLCKWMCRIWEARLNFCLCTAFDSYLHSM